MMFVSQTGFKIIQQKSHYEKCWIVTNAKRKHIKTALYYNKFVTKTFKKANKKYDKIWKLHITNIFNIF